MKTTKCRICGGERFERSNQALCHVHYLRYFRDWAKRNHDKYLETKRRSRVKRYHESAEERLRTRANAKINKAIKAGRMKRKKCWCGEMGQAHHDSYKKENWLTVRWLCIKHHARWHRLYEPTY